VPLGIVPRGTGNQLAANLGIPDDVEDAVEVVASGVPAPLDLGCIDGTRYFALMAGAGWDGEVISACTRELKDRWGFWAYLVTGLRKLVSPPSIHFRITADGQEIEVSAATVLVANAGQIFSGIFPLELHVAPGSSFRDGFLDVCIFAPRTLPDVAAVLWKVARNHHMGDERMIYLKAREVRIEADPPVMTQVDGECAGVTPLEVRAVEGGVQVLVPGAP
ncbi:MAG: hypothetical protein M3P24_07530, partial [Gemmatimonadota bacterium]|nr:hypothetical protein [Gemmatimonadota bacterium]